MNQKQHAQEQLVPNGWTLKTIGDIAQLRQGLQISTSKRFPEYKKGRLPLLKITDLPTGKYSEYVEDIPENYIAHENDIIFTRTGQVGLVYTNKKGVVHNNCFKVITNNEKFDKYFIFYFLKVPQVTRYALAVASGSVQSDLTHTAFKTCPILFPISIHEQKRIGDLLHCLDRKIENLRRQNETLEAIAQTLFKHWFVDFEFPNADGKPYKSSGGEMVPSEIGEIPVGWRIGTLGDIGKNIRSGINEDEIQPEMSYIALEHMPRNQIALDSWGTAADIASNKFVFTKGNILFGKLRPYFHKVGISFVSGICSTDILVLDSKSKNTFGFFLMVVSSDEFIRYVSLAAEGTRMPRTSWQYMKEYPIYIPDNSVLSVFNELVKASVEKIENNIFQIQTLTKTRDVLLPKLMSGKLRIKD